MKIYDDYSKLNADIGGSDARYLVDDVAPIDEARCREFAARIGLDVQAAPLAGAALMYQDGDRAMRLERSRMYGLAIPGADAMECALVMLATVRHRHGAGRLWVLCGMPHIVVDDGKRLAAPLEIEVDGKKVRAQHVVMRFFYGHEAQAVPVVDVARPTRIDGNAEEWLMERMGDFRARPRFYPPEPVPVAVHVAPEDFARMARRLGAPVTSDRGHGSCDWFTLLTPGGDLRVCEDVRGTAGVVAWEVKP